MQETQVRSLGLEDPLEKGMATHSRILDLEIPQMEEPISKGNMDTRENRPKGLSNNICGVIRHQGGGGVLSWWLKW